jgi:hypothetical protein
VALFVLIMIRRATANVRKDFRSGRSKLWIIITRMLLDRGFWDVNVYDNTSMKKEQPKTPKKIAPTADKPEAS